MPREMGILEDQPRRIEGAEGGVGEGRGGGGGRGGGRSDGAS
jgi:hypothetical protein